MGVRAFRTALLGVRIVAIGVAALILATWLPVPPALLGTGGVAYGQQSQRDQAPPKPAMPAEVKPLLDADTDTWLAGVTALRADPRRHDLLVQALANRPNSPRRWRLAYHLLEWGTPDDLPLVAQQIYNADGRERVELVAALEGLYSRPLHPVDLARVITGFTYTPQGPAQPFAPEIAGRWLVSDFAIRAYYEDGLPVRLVERMVSLKGHGYDSRSALADAMQRQLQGRQWADYGERLLAPIFPVPQRLAQDGTLQVQLTNPESRQIIVELTLQCWYGRFADVPAPIYVLIPAGQTLQQQIPVRIVAPSDPGRAQVFLRAHEANVPQSMEAQKLDVAVRR
jgi:hypothetical protein